MEKRKKEKKKLDTITTIAGLVSTYLCSSFVASLKWTKPSLQIITQFTNCFLHLRWRDVALAEYGISILSFHYI